MLALFFDWLPNGLAIRWVLWKQKQESVQVSWKASPHQKLKAAILPFSRASLLVPTKMQCLFPFLFCNLGDDAESDGRAPACGGSGCLRRGLQNVLGSTGRNSVCLNMVINVSLPTWTTQGFFRNIIFCTTFHLSV